MINPLFVGSGTSLGIGLGLGSAKAYKKITGKTAGTPASPMHVLTNDKLDKKGKADVVKEQLVESAKDSITVGKLVIGSAAAASLVAGNSTKVAGFLHSAKSKVGNLLSKVTVDNKNLKEIVQNNNIYKKLNPLPTPAKAAIAAATAAAAIIFPAYVVVGSQKAGYIEGKHEANSLKRSMEEMMFAEKCCVAKNQASKVGCVA